MPKDKETKDEKEVDDEWSVQEVPTQTTPMIVKDGKAYTIEVAVAEILNRLAKLEKVLE